MSPGARNGTSRATTVAASERLLEAKPPTVHVRASSAFPSLLSVREHAGELWEYRELLFFLAWRDIKVRYKQTVLGAGWAVLQPMLMMVAFSIFFGTLGHIPSDGIPYPVFVYCGLVPWQLFSFALSSSANALVMNERLLTKVYFPRLLLPIAGVLSGLVDFALSFLVLLLMMLYYGIVPTVSAWALPALVLLAVVVPTSVGIGLSALNARFRDVRHTLPFLTQLWLLATPIGYPSSLVPGRWTALYGLNPMAGVVEGFRWALLGRAGPLEVILLPSVSMVAGILVVSVWYFVKVESTLADVI